jgi:hypothetical protein
MDTTVQNDVVTQALNRSILPYLRPHLPENADPVIQTEEATLSVCAWSSHPLQHHSLTAL